VKVESTTLALARQETGKGPISANALPLTLEAFAYSNQSITNYQTADVPPSTLGSLHGFTT
jgi:hypothetical protein